MLDPQITAPPQSVSVTAPPQTPLATQSQAPPDQIPQQPAPPAPSAQQANVAHSAMVGHGFKALLSSMGGTTTQYQQTPEGPVPVQVKNSGGDFFKHILAGAILGGAAGAEHNDGSGAGYGGAARGAAAVQANNQQQQQMRQQQAQQQFQNKLTADKDTREATAADTENTLRKAEIQMYNLNKVKALQDIHQGSFNDHTALVTAAKPIVTSYNASGLTPIREGVSETDHDQWLKDHPGDSSLDWQPVGVTNYVDKDNNVGYQTVWDAYDPKGKIKVAPALIEDWTDSGLLGHRPDLAAALKPDANGDITLPYQGLIRLQQQSDSLRAMTKSRQADDFTQKEQTATLEHLAALKAQEKAAATASGSETTLRNLQIKDATDLKTAQTNLSKNGWDKLTPADKVALQPQVQKDIDDIRRDLSDPVLKEELGSNDPTVVKAAQDRATELHQNLDEARKRNIFVPPSAAAQAAPIAYTDPTQPGKQFNIPPGQEQAFLKAHPQATKVGGSANPDEQVQVQFPDGSTTNMTRSELQQKQVDASNTDISANPAAAAYAKAKVIGPAPAPVTNPIAHAAAVQSLM